MSKHLAVALQQQASFVSWHQLIQGVPFKTRPNNSHIPQYKYEIRSKSTPYTGSSSLPHDTQSREPWLLSHCSSQLHLSCAGTNIVYSQTECVFILEHYFASKLFAAVREAFSNVYPVNEVPNQFLTGNISGHRNCLSVTSALQVTKQLILQPYQFQAVHHLQQWDMAARFQYCHWFHNFVREGVHV
jgi:hypothetical protein